MNNKSKYLLTVSSLILFNILIVLIKTVDVAKTGVGDTEIGLYHLNNTAKEFIGLNMQWYKVTEVLGILAILSGGIFALAGLFQLIKRKSLFKVDKEILCLGGLYVIMGLIYVIFEKVIINFRPIIMSGEIEPEASFPSSHTVLTVVIMGSIFMILGKYIKNKSALCALKSLCVSIAVITVTGRLISGVHWLTDILGGIILSVFLLSTFYSVVKN